MNNRAFTLVELLTVITIIGILAGLILMTSGFVQKKAASSRAEAEIQAMSAACESYKADNGIYPRNTADTDVLDARKTGTPSSYLAASKYLYGELSGDRDFNRQLDASAKQYMEFKPNMLTPSGGTTTPVTSIQDPFGFSYGYSTANAKYQETTPAPATVTGYNPTFDLWSTAGKTTVPTPGTATDVTNQWIKNW